MASDPTTDRRSSRQLVTHGLGAVDRQTKELRGLLRGRMLLACFVMFCFWAVLPIGSLRHMYDPGQPESVQTVLIFQTTIGILIGLIGFGLWLRPPEKVSTLRAWELIAFGGGFMILAVTNWYFIERFGLATPPI